MPKEKTGKLSVILLTPKLHPKRFGKKLNGLIKLGKERDFITDKEKADLLADNFTDVSSDDNRNDIFLDNKKRIKNNLHINNNNDNIINDPFKMSELEEAIDVENARLLVKMVSEMIL